MKIKLLKNKFLIDDGRNYAIGAINPNKLGKNGESMKKEKFSQSVDILIDQLIEEELISSEEINTLQDLNKNLEKIKKEIIDNLKNICNLKS